MYVKSIEFSGFDDTAPEGPSRGAVLLVNDTTRIQIPLTVPRHVEVLKSRHRLRLLAMALKRARQMPEYLEGDEIHFAPGLLPHGLTSVDLTPRRQAPKSG
ncbi:hypothetical protein [Tropicibacter oceani]|uniref:Uncharacterized protein n=1 Tax=Tropicibacter oceani TaxID=3058420 RepID=A0ABY8QJF6_9RHOB|nr:hypothetical protein [Tropicibacter oceani]WGW04156.1 hypothetical protein QF118_01065 [Tropicibacter oceani]